MGVVCEIKFLFTFRFCLGHCSVNAISFFIGPFYDDTRLSIESTYSWDEIRIHQYPMISISHEICIQVVLFGVVVVISVSDGLEVNNLHTFVILASVILVPMWYNWWVWTRTTGAILLTFAISQDYTSFSQQLCVFFCHKCVSNSITQLHSHKTWYTYN